MNKVVIFLSLLGILFSFHSCKKPAGKGGGGSISGTVYENRFDPNGKLISREVAKESRVYITYGTNEVYDAKTDTDNDGQYLFPTLRKGAYNVFVFSDCDSCDNAKNIVSQSIDLPKNKSDLTEIDFDFNKNVKIRSGTGKLEGIVMEQKYLGTTAVQDPYPAQKNNVYIVYDTDKTYFDKSDVSPNGSYAFSDLIEGNYTVFVYSGCTTCVDTLMAMKQKIILKKGGKSTVPTITIRKQI